MSYAVIETGGKQYKITKGATLKVESLGLEKGADVKFDKVLLVVQDGAIQVGTPYVSGVTVSAKVLDKARGEKIYVGKFRAKSKYRRLTGHRQELTHIEISDIVHGKKTEKKAEKAE